MSYFDYFQVTLVKFQFKARSVFGAGFSSGTGTNWVMPDIWYCFDWDAAPATVPAFADDIISRVDAKRVRNPRNFTIMFRPKGTLPVIAAGGNYTMPSTMIAQQIVPLNRWMPCDGTTAWTTAFNIAPLKMYWNYSIPAGQGASSYYDLHTTVYIKVKDRVI